MNWNILRQAGAMQKGKQDLLVHIGQSTGSSSQGPGFDTQQLPTFHYLLFHLHNAQTICVNHIPLTWSHHWTGSPSVSCPSKQPVCFWAKIPINPSTHQAMFNIYLWRGIRTLLAAFLNAIKTPQQSPLDLTSCGSQRDALYPAR